MLEAVTPDLVFTISLKRNHCQVLPHAPFAQYRAREGMVDILEERVNGCMQRVDSSAISQCHHGASKSEIDLLIARGGNGLPSSVAVFLFLIQINDGRAAHLCEHEPLLWLRQNRVLVEKGPGLRNPGPPDWARIVSSHSSSVSLTYKSFCGAWSCDVGVLRT
jgi:hypothetical protein